MYERGDGNVDILLMMWFVIDMVLLLILPFRKTVTKYENVMRRRSIESVKSLGARLMDVLSKIFLLIPVGLIVYIFNTYCSRYDNSKAFRVVQRNIYCCFVSSYFLHGLKKRILISNQYGMGV